MNEPDTGRPDEGDQTADRDFREALRSHSAGRSLGFMLWHTTLRWQRGVDAALAPFSLTHGQALLLTSAWWLARAGGVPNQRQVADHAGVGEVMASQIIKVLERNGLIERTTHPDDPRGKALSVTDRGREVAEHAVVALDGWDAQFFASVDEPQTVLAALQRLAGRAPQSS